MAVSSVAVSVTSSATPLTGSGYGDYKAGQSIAISNVGSATVYVGGSNVSTTNGFPLAAGESMGIDLASEGEKIYGRVASGTNEVRILATGV